MHCWVQQHECVECVTDDHCWDPIGESLCDQQTHTCVRVCRDNQDCGRNEVCDTTLNPAVCVECYAGDTSVCDGWGLVCDVARHTCVECLQDGDCRDLTRLHCLTDFNMCVECYDDRHCDTGKICDLIAYTCLPGTGRGLCEPCSDDSQCGGAQDLCVEFRDPVGAQIVDQGCGQACGGSGLPCPPGYRCAQLGMNTTQCVPNNAEDIPTCAGIRDMGSPCRVGGNCGVEDIRDGTCVPSVDGGYCSVRCDTSSPVDPSMCIDPWSCTLPGGFFAVCTIQ
jgi:hypothetical protein